MFDNIHFEKENVLPKKYFNDKAYKPFEYRDLHFTPFYTGGTTRIGGFFSDVDNMRFSYLIDRKMVTLKNSLHKFAMGWNHKNLKISQYLDAVEKISDKTGIDWMGSNFKKAEIGTNFIDPQLLSSVKILYKNKEFVTPIQSAGGIALQKKHTTSYFKLSYYDKYIETLQHCKQPHIRSVVPNALKRFEFQFSKTYFHQFYKLIGSEKVCDFLDKNSLSKIRHKTNAILTDVAFEKGYDDNTIIGIEDLKLFAIVKDPLLFQKYKNEHPHSYKKKQRRMKELKSKAMIKSDLDLEKEFYNSWEFFLS